MKEYIYIDIKQIINMAVNRSGILLLCVMTAVLSVGFINFYFLDPVYEAKITLYIINRNNNSQLPINYNELLVGNFLVEDYRELVKSRTVTHEVISEMALNMSISQLVKKINVSTKESTRILEISVQDFDPVLAMNIANKIGQVFINKAIEIMNAETVNVIDEASLPSVPAEPNIVMNIVIAGVAGLTVGIFIVLILEFLNTKIKDVGDIKRYIGIEVLGKIHMVNEE